MAFASDRHRPGRKYIELTVDDRRHTYILHIYSEMAHSRLDAARQTLLEAFHSKKFTEPTVHTVTFQPFGPARNADRMTVEHWSILGQRWLFLAVCDGKTRVVNGALTG